MKKLASIIALSLSAFALFASGGCAVSTPLDGDLIADEGLSTEERATDDGLEWNEVSPGILMSDDGETRRWIIEGEEAHAVFRQQIEEKLDAERDPEGRGFYGRVLADIDEAKGKGELQKPTSTSSALNYSTSISEVPGGLKAWAHASRGWGYVRAQVYVNINGNSASDSKSKSDLCISNCSVTVEKSVSSCPNAPTSCKATAFAQASGSSHYEERTTCPSMPCVTCCPRTACYTGECGYVPNGCGGSLYCGTCGGGGGGCVKVSPDGQSLIQYPCDLPSD